MPLEQKSKNDQVMDLEKLEHSLPRSPRDNRAYLVLRCLASVFVTLLVLEGYARFIVSVSGAYVGPSIEFDRAYALAQQPCAADRQLVVCIGGSFSKRALYPELIENRFKEANLNVEVRNLATVACSSYEQVALLRAATEHAKKPVLVISDLRALAFEKHYLDKTIGYEKLRFDESYVGRRIKLGDRKDLFSQFKNYIEKNFYLIGYRTYLRYTVMCWIAPVFNSEQFRFTRLMRGDHLDGQSPHGWGPVFEFNEPQNLTEGHKQFNDLVKLISDLLGPAPHQWTYDYTKPVEQYCAAQHIPLLYVWEPVHPAMSKVFEKAGAPLPIFQKLLTTIGGMPNTYFLDWHASDSDVHHFKNMDHVNYQGAITFSEMLSSQLLKPPYRSFFSFANGHTTTKSVATSGNASISLHSVSMNDASSADNATRVNPAADGIEAERRDSGVSGDNSTNNEPATAKRSATKAGTMMKSATDDVRSGVTP